MTQLNLDFHFTEHSSLNNNIQTSKPNNEFCYQNTPLHIWIVIRFLTSAWPIANCRTSIQVGPDKARKWRDQEHELIAHLPRRILASSQKAFQQGPVDQKKSFEHEARSPPAAPGLHRPPRGLHCCRRHWVWRLSKELLLHMCKLNSNLIANANFLKPFKMLKLKFSFSARWPSEMYKLEVFFLSKTHH